ncbi:winged helix-turn-helix domain-containing protein [Streptomyces sp. M10(2022)]
MSAAAGTGSHRSGCRATLRRPRPGRCDLPGAAGSRPIELTPAEYRLLRCLLVNAEQVLSKEQIGAHVWRERPTDGAVERLVSRLRRKVNREEPG